MRYLLVRGHAAGTRDLCRRWDAITTKPSSSSSSSSPQPPFLITCSPPRGSPKARDCDCFFGGAGTESRHEMAGRQGNDGARAIS